MQNKIFFVSLGCDKNRVDSEEMLGFLENAGFSFTASEWDADVIVINSCCFIDSAKEETIAAVLEMAEHKNDGACKCLIMAGCMAQRYADEIRTELPEVDGLVGTSKLEEVVPVVQSCLQRFYAEHGEVAPVFEKTKNVARNENRVLTTGGAYSFLKIADGCDKRCTYCIIPYIRGSYRSYPMEDLIAQAEFLAASGVKELILVAQETTLYGVDLYGEKMLPELLHRLCRISGFRWIRILYTYPEEITEELLKAMAEEEKVCNYIDMPIQHASDRILKRMGRRCSREDLIQKIRMCRDIIPDITLRTTLISGFPGETDEDHKELVDFVRKMQFDHLGVFTYSQEEGTPAAKFDDQIPEEVKESRRDEIMRIQQKIAAKKLRSRKGKTLEAFVEGKLADEPVYVCRTRADAPDVDGCFFVETDETFMTGDFIAAKVKKTGEYDLYGCLEGENHESAE